MKALTFGLKLKELRVLNGDGQRELGEKLGVGAPQIRRYENDEVLPDHEKVKALCKLYKYDFVSIIYGNLSTQQTGSSPENDEFKAKYISLLEQENNQKGAIITVSLTALQVGQQSILANVEAGLDWAIEREAGGNRKQAELMRKDLDRRIGEKLGLSQRKGIASGK